MSPAPDGPSHEAASGDGETHDGASREGAPRENPTDAGRLEIEYCTGCRWLTRAAWMAQELLTTFEEELSEVALVPGTGGVLDVRLDGREIWSRSDRGRFPEMKELKREIRDRLAPERSLGHSDRDGASDADEEDR